jgi:hypothetical protein
MVADSLTKALPSPKVKYFASELGLCVIWGGVLELQIPHSTHKHPLVCFSEQVALWETINSCYWHFVFGIL